jgi:hypothetical protein
VDGNANNVARAVAVDILGEEVFWDWDGMSFSTLSGSVLNYIQLLGLEKDTITILAESRYTLPLVGRLTTENFL